MTYKITLKNSNNRECVYCSKPFRALNSQINRGKGHFCSKACVTSNRNKSNAICAKERFFKNIEKTENCWIYVKGKSLKYPKIKLENRKDMSVHRFSFELHFGKIPQGLYVCHKCDNTRCVNPEHLFLGTPLDNMDDKMSKNRHKVAYGSSQGHAKLNEEQVKDIKIALANKIPQRTLANKYGVSQSKISMINLGKNWKHVT